MKDSIITLAYVSFIILMFSLFDSVFGGAISTALAMEGWTPFDQRANDAYQAAFGLIVLLFVGAIGWAGDYKSAALLLVLLVGYVEDTLYYLLWPLSYLPIKFLVKLPPDPFGFPPVIGGWLGWLSRVVFGGSLSLPLPVVFFLNVFTIATAIAAYFALNSNVRSRQ